MKTRNFFIFIVVELILIGVIGARISNKSLSTNPDYVLISWNDLGMHCTNIDFSKVVVLPPYNNLIAQVVKKGSATSLPQLVTSDLTLNYEIPGNTYSVGKTNFWSYEDQLFGVNLPNDTGLTGVGLSGTLTPSTDHFVVEGIPITPFTDSNLTTENPYQLALLSLYDTNGTLLATTQPVIPVSGEIGCVSNNCHPSQQNILNEHDNVSGFNQNGPVLCASCHSSNALGTTGQPGLESLSEVIHKEHDNTNNCYKCHPGSNTQCHRGVMNSVGFTCIDCHGDTENVGESISNGREPWLDEPSCATSGCHTSIYAEEPGLLYRQSKGHGGLYCSACHGSPHAIFPSQQANDNVQNIGLQGFAGTLSQCSVCHSITPNMPGPHGIVVTDIETLANEASESRIDNIFPNPVSTQGTVEFSIAAHEHVSMEIFNVEGKVVLRLINRNMETGSYKISFAGDALKSGIYYLNIVTPSNKNSIKFIKI